MLSAWKFVMDLDVLDECKNWNCYDCVISTWLFIPWVLLTLPIGYDYSSICWASLLQRRYYCIRYIEKIAKSKNRAPSKNYTNWECCFFFFKSFYVFRLKIKAIQCLCQKSL